MKKGDINKILSILEETYPNAKCALNYNSPYELMVSTILSAQCTDIRVNKVTEELFKEYNTPEKIGELTEEELGEKIRSCGFYNNKSKNIIGASKLLIEKYGGKVPNKMEELITLPGVGRKTANVVLSNAFDVPAIAVDTHVFRVSNRIGLAKSKNVEGTELQLMKNIPKKQWTKAHHLLIFHGRNICVARKPKCDICPIKHYCDFFGRCLI